MQNSENNPIVSVCLVPYQNEKKFLTILSSVKKTLIPDSEIIIIDNNPTDKYKLLCEKLNFRYHHNANKGMLAGAMNYAISMAKGKYIVYLCANHIHIYSNDWLSYMVKYMGKLNELYVMGGDVLPFRNNNHVQGGLYIARTAWMKAHPYSLSFPFTFMDVEISKRIMKDRKKMIKIPLIHSSMFNEWNRRSHDTNMQMKRIKIVHSHLISNYVKFQGWQK